MVNFEKNKKGQYEHQYELIPGWFDFQRIYKRMVAEAKDGDKFIEIGTANGKSAAYMCVEIANSGKNIEFHTVDIFPPENEQYNQEKNVREWLKPFEFCYVHKSDSVEFLKTIKPFSIQFIFIDGKHETNPLIYELFEAVKIVKYGGFVGGHDYWQSFPDVKRTVDAFAEFGKYDVEVIDKSYLFQL